MTSNSRLWELMQFMKGLRLFEFVSMVAKAKTSDTDALSTVGGTSFLSGCNSLIVQSGGARCRFTRILAISSEMRCRGILQDRSGEPAFP
jgi:hypothetical protein